MLKKQPVQRKNTPTFREAHRAYRNYLVSEGCRTTAVMEYVFDMVEDAWGDYPVTQITRDDVMAYIKMRRQMARDGVKLARGRRKGSKWEDCEPYDPPKDSTLRREITVISATLNYTQVAYGCAIKAQFTKLGLRKESERKDRLKDEEVRGLLVAVDNGDDAEVMSDLVRFALDSGARLEAVVTLRWDQIDFQTGVVSLDDKTLKATSERVKGRGVVPLHFKLVNRLSARRDAQRQQTVVPSYVFTLPGETKPVGKDWVRYRFKKAARAAGLRDGVTFHWLRHTFASNRLQGGNSFYEVKEMLGHATINTTLAYYAHFDPQKARQMTSREDLEEQDENE